MYIGRVCIIDSVRSFLFFGSLLSRISVASSSESSATGFSKFFAFFMTLRDVPLGEYAWFNWDVRSFRETELILSVSPDFSKVFCIFSRLFRTFFKRS